MKYEKVVEQWNEFCIESGIRDYCQNKCKGLCCISICPTNKNLVGDPCGGKCNESITCTTYLCNALFYGAFPEEVNREFEQYIYLMFREVYKLNGTFKPNWGHGYPGTEDWQNPKELIQKMLAVDWPKIIESLTYHNSPRPQWCLLL